MSRKERERLVVFGRVKAGELSRVEAAEALGLSLRQVHRVYVRWRENGDTGLVHASRGRSSGRRWDESEKAKALQLRRERYWDLGPTHLSEKLGKDHGIWASHDTVRRWLIEAGLLEHGRRGRRSRRRRQRESRLGAMVQMDGSPHAWFGDRGAACVLMTVIDDATDRRRGRFFASETMEAAMDSFGLWCQRFGVPEKLYVDRHGIYRSDRDPTLEEIKSGKKPVTQFGRAMKELDVRLILARSPQAKGRVERSNRTLQERLVPEFRLANISSVAEANAWLEKTKFWEQCDEQFGTDADEAVDAHRPLVVKLSDVLCVKEKRSVGLDGCVQWQGRVLQLEKPGKLKQVELWHRPDGSLEVLGDGRRLSYSELSVPTRQAHRAEQKRLHRKPIVNNKVHKPTARQRISLQPSPRGTGPTPALRKAG